LFGNNGDITIGYRIDQRAFSSIRGAYHRYIEAFPQYLAAPVIIQMHLDLFEDGAELLAALSDRTRRNVLVGEIDSSLDPASRTDQAGAPILVELGQTPVILLQSKAPLSIGLGRNEIENGFSLCQVQPPVFHCSAGELTGFGGAAARHGSECGK